MAAPSVSTSESTYFGAGGLTLFRRSWEPADGAAKALVVLSHGLGEHTGRYDHVGRHLAQHGYAVWSHDHRGHGRSQGTPVFVEAFSTYEADLETLRLAAVAAHPKLPRVLLGHSMGGAIALGHAIDYPDRFDALVLTGPLLDAARGLPAPVVAVGKLLALVAPKIALVKLDAGQVSRDPAVVRAYLDDPLVHRGRITVGLGRQLIERTGRFAEEVARLQLPVLVVHGTADGLVPIETSRALVPRFGSTDVTLVEEDGLYHEVLNEPERARVLDTITEWMDQRVAALGVRS